jgi:SH3-like domain-containing protein
MRVPCAFLGLAVTFTALPARAEPQFPYSAQVAMEDVVVRSGPGMNYYPTSKLMRGDTVEVHRHDPGGWYAIRPPDGNYSWVSSRHMRIKENRLGEVTTPDAPARVGSSFSNVRDVIQVRLQQGEIVEILDEFNGGGQTWYKIAPPAGEFRWIAARHLDLQPSGPNHADSSVRWAQGENESELDSAGQDRDLHGNSQTGHHASNGAGDERQDRWVQQTASRSGRQAWKSVGTSDDVPSHGGSDGLDAIQQDLSETIAQQPSGWELEPLKQRTEQLLDRAGTALERGRARKILHQIERLENIQHRHARLTGGSEELSPPYGDASSFGAGPLARFDRAGTLRPVVSRTRRAPRFALVDDTGAVICFVTPAPGVNLQAYLGQRIGVSGSRSYLAEYQRDYFLAQQVTPLDERQLR